MTKILQIWKLLFTKTFSHHDVQISNSFIFVQYVMKQILLIFVFMRKIIQKLWLLLCIHPQFRAKKIISNECAISCKPGFVLIRKLCEISCKKVISWKRNCCAKESTVSWKPYLERWLTITYGDGKTGGFEVVNLQTGKTEEIVSY